MIKQSFNFIFAVLILMCFGSSFFMIDMSKKPEAPDYVSKRVVAIMKVFDYYKSDLSETQKFLIACSIVKQERYYNLDGLSFLGVLKVESSMKYRDKRGGIKTSSAGAKNITQLMPSIAKSLIKQHQKKRGMASRSGGRDRLSVKRVIEDPVLATWFGGKYYSNLKKEHKKPLFYNTSYNQGGINKAKLLKIYNKGGCTYHRAVTKEKNIIQRIMQRIFKAFEKKKINVEK